MSACTARKRARVESKDIAEDVDITEDSRERSLMHREQGREQTVLERDEEFWFEDGTVILTARNVEFRVFKGILAHHSPVFKDMFSLPQPSHESSRCPVVQLSDSPDDICHMLRVTMPNCRHSPFLPKEPSFNAISATIRLGHKYQMWSLVEHALKYLSKYYPVNYADWSPLSSYGPPTWKLAHTIGVVNLARLTEETVLLPVALFICCKLGPDIVNGLDREDGSHEQLMLHDLGLCFGAIPRLIEARVAAALRIFDTHVSKDCLNESMCHRALRSIVRKLDGSIGRLWVPDPFDSYMSLLKETRTVLCEACYAMVETREDKELRASWKQLPALIGVAVDSWDERDSDIAT